MYLSGNPGNNDCGKYIHRKCTLEPFLCVKFATESSISAYMALPPKNLGGRLANTFPTGEVGA